MNLNKDFKKKEKEYKNEEHIVKITKSKGAVMPAVYVQSDTYGVCIALSTFIKTLLLSNTIDPRLIRYVIDTTFEYYEENGEHESE